MKILAVDPGMNATGFAILETLTVPAVLGLGLIRPKRATPDLDLPAIVQIAEGITQHVGSLALDLVVVEWPRVRRGSAQNPQDLLPLTAVNGAVIAALRQSLPNLRLAALSADVWTRGKKKELRQAAFLARLDRENPRALKEVEAVKPPSLRHNAVDALHLAYEAYERKL